MWQSMMYEFGVTSNDCIVASERYGKKLANITGAQFYPYDIDRALNPTKATRIRNDPVAHFDNIIPEFQPYMRTRITVFGAESTGKTTLSRELAETLGATWIFEYARPYLEETINEITYDSMAAIWRGQKALQAQARQISASPYIIQDTDLFSTVGYWQFPHWQPAIGPCPDDLIRDALLDKSDLYCDKKVIFHLNQIRCAMVGINAKVPMTTGSVFAKKYDLPYVVIETNDRDDRRCIALEHIQKTARERTDRLWYDRHDL